MTSKNLVTVTKDTKITEVARLIYEHNFNGLPVIANDNKLVGLITEMDLISNDSLGIHIPSFAKLLIDLNILSQVKGKDKKSLKYIAFANAESVMKVAFPTVNPETPLTELIKIFNEKMANPVPVVDEQNRLVGIVARSDIVKLIGKFTEAELDFLKEIED